jgi:tetratricopeptide (TPR) repeat protein
MWEKAGRTLARVTGTLLVMVLASPALAEETADWKCNAQTEVTPDERIAACTSIIDLGKYGRQALIRAFFNRAAAFRKKGEFQRAAADYGAVIELYPANVYAYYGRAYSYFYLGDFDRAIADSDRTIQLNPRSWYAYYCRGIAHHKKKEYDQAIADYTRAIQLRHQSPSGDQKAVVNDKEGDLAPPLNADDRAAISSGASVFQARGSAHLDKGDFDRAIADYDRAVQLNPRSWYAYYCRGVAHYRKREYDQAIADFTRAIELRYQNPSGDQKAAVNDRESDLPPPAFADDRAAISSGAIVFNWRGSAHFGKRDLDHAIADFDQAIRLYPKYKYALRSRCAVYNVKSDFDRAIADCDRALELDPNDVVAYRSRALAHWQSGSLSKSLSDLDQAIRLDPKDAYPALWREIVARRSDQPSQLSEAAAQLDMSKWPAPIVSLFLGTMTPEQLLGAADDSDPKKRKGQVCEANFYTAEVALQRGSKEEARRLFEVAVADCPRTFVEWQAAGAELKAIGATP